MKQGITITKAAPEDAKALANIKLRTWLESYQNQEFGIGEADIFAKDFLCPQRIAKRAEHMQTDDGMNYTLVAREGTQIVGYGRATKGSEAGEIATLYILAEWQGMGIGSAILGQLLDWLDSDRPVELGVVPYNQKAITFYKKFGFQLGNSVPHDQPTFPSGKDLPEVEMVRKATKLKA